MKICKNGNWKNDKNCKNYEKSIKYSIEFYQLHVDEISYTVNVYMRPCLIALVWSILICVLILLVLTQTKSDQNLLLLATTQILFCFGLLTSAAAVGVNADKIRPKFVWWLAAVNFGLIWSALTPAVPARRSFLN